MDVKIIGWNKARKSMSESFTVHIHDYQKLKEVSGASTVLFVSTEKKLDDQYANALGFKLWGRDELEYYETLVDTLGHFAKYEILHSLGIRTREETNIFQVLALHFHQSYSKSQTDFFLFTAPPQLLLQTCVVLRKAAGSKNAYQRILKKDRLSKIANFVKGENALLPPNIIVHLGDEIIWDPLEIPKEDKSGRKITLAREGDYELVLLKIPRKYASMEIINGQHRLFGFINTDAATREYFNLVVLGTGNISPRKRTDTFVAINDKARRMDPNLVAYLRPFQDENECQKDNELMAINIAYKLNQISPFKEKIRLLDKGKEKITLRNFAGADLKGLISEKGLLRKYYLHESDEYVGVLRLYFGTLKSLFPTEYNEPEKYIIFTNRGVSAFLKLLRSMLKTEDTALSRETIKKYLSALKREWKGGWETKSLKSSYVGTQGRNDFHRDLIKAIQRKYPEFVQ